MISTDANNLLIHLRNKISYLVQSTGMNKIVITK